MDIEKIYKTHVINKLKIIRINGNQYNMWLVISTYMHYTGLFDIENAIPPFSDR